ncbi:MAG: glycosyltransferase family 4 protein [Nocardioidaceae bacterium]
MTERGADRPRVVVVAQARPALGGIATFAELLADSPVVAKTAEVTLLNTTRQAVRTAGRLTGGNVANVVADAVRVWRAARTADVVHLQSAPGRLLPLLRMWLLCVAARAGGARVLCHVHSGRINGGNPKGFRPTRAYRLVLARMGFVEAFLTVSRAGAEALRPLVPRRTVVEWVDNAVDVGAQPRARPGQDPAVLLFVGTLSRRKGLEELAAAAAALGESTSAAWSLQVVGGAAEVGEEEAAQMRAAFTDRGLAEAMLGSRPAGEVRELMAGASALVLPSHWEGQPMVILEAMASGLPVVASGVGAIPDVVRHEKDGLLVETGDVASLTSALRRIVEDSALRERLGASARRRAEESYDVSVLARRLGAFYRGERAAR